MWTVDIYSHQPLGKARGDLEDDLEEALGPRVTVAGGGAGEQGWNIDLEIADDSPPEAVVSEIVAFLRGWGVPGDTLVRVLPPGSERTEARTVRVFPP
jgi:hypothetical protein